jgi:uncharacterized repeat protein (TIGR01451 family)
MFVPPVKMKIFSSLRILALLVLGLTVAVNRVEAQSIGLSVTPSANAVAVSDSLTYTIVVSNLTGTIQDVIVSNILSAPIQFQGVSLPPPPSIAVSNGNTMAFGFQMTAAAIAQMTLTVGPTQAGSLTNSVTVFFSIGAVPPATKRVVTQVTNVLRADLAVGMTGPPSEVFTNDNMTYGITVTNLGPGSATNVFLTNTLPAGVGYKTNSLALTRLGSGTNVVFSLGTLTNGAFKNFQITVVPTNAGPLTFSSVLSTNTALDTNSVNNSASVNITVGTFIYGQLIATNVSTMAYDPQTGLMNQTIRLTNIGTNAVAAARVIVSGLTNWLYNAVGTNSGNPYVVYGATLDTNQFVDLVLEYFVPTRLPITVANSNYTAVGVSLVDLSAPGGTNGVFSITLMTNLPNGNVLIEFESVLSSNYTVLYGNDLLSITQAAQPSIVAPANRTQWIDDGPPKTVSTPTNGGRYYRVRLNP